MVIRYNKGTKKIQNKQIIRQNKYNFLSIKKPFTGLSVCFVVLLLIGCFALLLSTTETIYLL
jgi:hypothetical protein